MKTDAQLLQDVIEELTWDAAVPETQISVQVDRGVVTLAGPACSASEWLSATRAARRVCGVQAVATALPWSAAQAAVRAQQRAQATDRVRQRMGSAGKAPGQPPRRGRLAADVSADIEAALRASSLAEADNVAVSVRGQDVTLTGTVQSWDERRLATNAAWGVPGVRNVIDLLRLSR